MKIKVCGMRDPENIKAMLDLPIDYMGFIFYENSPRAVKEDSGLKKWLEDHQEKFGDIKRVGVFVNAEIDEILNTVHDYKLDYVQLHGSERPEYCRELLAFYEMSSTLREAALIKAFSVDENFDFNQTNPYSGLCKYFLFDTKSAAPGGSGQRFDWALLDRYQGTTPFILAGGIGPEHADNIRRFPHPQLHGVDLNSRFEIEPGLKSVEKIRAFVTTLKSGVVG